MSAIGIIRLKGMIPKSLNKKESFKMKVAVSATGKDLNAQIDSRFGRCHYFIVVETDTLFFEVFENSNASFSSGAGIESASLMASKGVSAVLTGSCGPKAAQVFANAGIDVFTGLQGTVQDAVVEFKNGRLSGATGHNVSEKFGLNAGRPLQDPENFSSNRKMGMGGGRGMGGGGGMGMGGGRGMGGGGGMGMGGGRGMGMRTSQSGASQPKSADTKVDGDLEQLKAQAAALQAQIDAIQSKIKDLE
ncbi:MAG: NifB/NifX family molybdenum-iron cluster-binding protein [Desulfobacterales bacterium]